MLWLPRLHESATLAVAIWAVSGSKIAWLWNRPGQKLLKKELSKIAVSDVHQSSQKKCSDSATIFYAYWLLQINTVDSVCTGCNKEVKRFEKYICFKLITKLSTGLYNMSASHS